MGQVIYLDQLKPAGSLRAYAGPATRRTAPPEYAYDYDVTDWSCVVEHASSLRGACAWRAVAFTRAECEWEALAHHEAEHVDVHNSMGRTIDRTHAKSEEEYRQRAIARLREYRGFWLSFAGGFRTVRHRFSSRQQPYVLDALRVIASEAEADRDPVYAAWAQGLLDKQEAKQQAA